MFKGISAYERASGKKRTRGLFFKQMALLQCVAESGPMINSSSKDNPSLMEIAACTQPKETCSLKEKPACQTPHSNSARA